MESNEDGTADKEEQKHPERDARVDPDPLYHRWLTIGAKLRRLAIPIELHYFLTAVFRADALPAPIVLAAPNRHAQVQCILIALGVVALHRHFYSLHAKAGTRRVVCRLEVLSRLLSKDGPLGLRGSCAGVLILARVIH